MESPGRGEVKPTWNVEGEGGGQTYVGCPGRWEANPL